MYNMTSIERHIKSFMKGKKTAEDMLRKELKNDLSEENIAIIQDRIKYICYCSVNIKFFKFIQQHKVLDGLKYMPDISSWEKIERKIRKKFYVPKAIQTIWNPHYDILIFGDNLL